MNIADLEALTPAQQMALCWQLLDRCDASHPATTSADCWIWTGHIGHAGHPIINSHIVCPHEPKLARRLAAWLGGIAITEGRPVMATCGERRCINPAHLRASSASAIGKQAAAQGAFSRPSRLLAIAIGRRNSATAKLDMDKARAIRASTLPQEQEAALHGVHQSMIGRIRQGKAWRDYSNPFAGLVR